MYRCSAEHRRTEAKPVIGIVFLIADRVLQRQYQRYESIQVLEYANREDTGFFSSPRCVAHCQQLEPSPDADSRSSSPTGCRISRQAASAACITPSIDVSSRSAWPSNQPSLRLAGDELDGERSPEDLGIAALDRPVGLSVRPLLLERVRVKVNARGHRDWHRHEPKPARGAVRRTRLEAICYHGGKRWAHDPCHGSNREKEMRACDGFSWYC